MLHWMVNKVPSTPQEHRIGVNTGQTVQIWPEHRKMKWLSLEMQNMIQKEESGSVNIQQSHNSSLRMSGIEISPLSTKNCQTDAQGENQRKKIKQWKERHSM